MKNPNSKKHITAVLPSLAVTTLLFFTAQSAVAGVDTWSGAGANENWSTSANWDILPSPFDTLIFTGGTGTSPNNDFAPGTAFGGILFSNTSTSFTLGGNSILLSSHTNNSIGVTNLDGNAQAVNNNLALDWGYYYFASPNAALNLNGSVAAGTGGVADFGANNINSTSLTLDGTGLISGLGGAGLIGNTGGGANAGGGFSALATISGGTVVPYTYSGSQVISAAGPIGVDNTTTLMSSWAAETTTLTTGFTRPAVALSTAFSLGANVTSLTVASATGITIGSVVTGTGVPAGVTVTSITGTTIGVTSFTSTAASTGNYTFSQVVSSVVVASATGISVGQAMTGTGVPANTTVTSVTGTTIGTTTFTCTAASAGNYTFAQTGVNSVTVTSASGILNGAAFAGTGVPNGVSVTSVAGNTVNLTSFTPTAVSSGNYTFGSTASDPANIEVTASAGNFTLAGGTSTTFGSNNTYINTALLTVAGTTKITTLLVPSGNGTLVLGSTNAGTGMYVGGIYLPGGETVQEITVGSGNSTFLTAGPMTGNPVPGEIVIGINGNNTSNEGEMNAAIKDNLSGGAVSVVYTGGGSLYVNDSGNTYSGGTYMIKGRVQCNTPTALGAGPVYISGGDSEISLQNIGAGTVSNSFYIYPASSYVGAATEGSIRSDGTGNIVLAGSIHVMGNPIPALPASPAGVPAVADRISTQSADTTIFAGQITGPGTLELYSAVSGATFLMSNITASANNWTGGLILDSANNDPGTLKLLANNQLGSNNLTLIQAGTGFARLDLNGFSDTISGLTGSSNILNEIGNFGAGTPTLTLGANNATATFGGEIGSGTSGNSLNLAKVGSGTQTLNGSIASYTGGTTVGGGALVFSGLGVPTSTSSITITNEGLLDVSGFPNAQFTNVSSISLANGTLSLGVASSSITNFLATTLNIGGSDNTIVFGSLPIVSSYPTIIHVIKYGTLNGTPNLVLAPLPPPPSPLVGTYVGHLTNNAVTSTIDLVLTGGPAPVRSLTWTGIDPSNPTFWDVASSVNWKDTNGNPTTYNQLDFTTFDDSAPGSTTVNLTTTLTPSSMTVSNNTKTYTFTGGGNLTGSWTLLKEGTGLMIMDNGTQNNFNGTTIAAGTVQVGNNDSSGDLGGGPIVNNGNLVFNRTDNPVLVSGQVTGTGGITQSGTGTLVLSNNNTFSGTVTVTAGVLQVGTSNSLGSSNSALVIESGASLDLNGNNLGSKPIFVSGSGAPGTGLGAIDNSGTNVFPAVAFVTLTGDTTFGTSGGNGGSTTMGRWDLRAAGGDTAGPTNAMLSTGGQPYNLTITGGAILGIVSATVDPALGNIDIQGGKLDYEGTTTGLGDPSKTITIESGAFLFLYDDSTPLNKNILVNNGGVIENNNSVNTIIGPVVLNTNSDGSQSYAEFQIDGTTSLNVNSVISGGGTLYKNTGGGTLNLNGTNTFTGPILLSTGVLSVNSDSSDVTNATSVNGGGLTVNGELGSPITTQGNTTLAGSGTALGLVDVSGNLLPGASNVVGTFTAAGGLTIEGGANAIFDLSTTDSVGGGNDLVAVHGTLTFNGGTITVSPFGLLATGVRYPLFTYTGSLVMNSAPSVSDAAGYTFTLDTSVNGQVAVIASGGPPVWNGGSATDSDWSDPANFDGVTIGGGSLLYFAGNTRLNNTNDTPADTSYGQIVFPPGAGAFTLNGNPLDPAGGIANNSTNAQTIDLGLDFAQNITLSGGATSSSPLIIGGGLTNISGGFATVTLAGTGTLTNLLGSNPSTGTNTLLMSNLLANWTLLDNASSTPLTVPWALNIFSGTFNYGSATSAPTLTSTTPNGTPQDNIVGQGAGAFGTFNMINGNLTLTARLDTGASVAGATGVVNQVGGVLTVNQQFQGANIAGGVSTVSVSGGTMNITGGTTFVASRGHGSLNISGSAAVNLTTLDVSRGIGDGTIGVVNLNGGVLSVNNISTATANSATPTTDDTATLNLNGGVLMARENNAAFITDSAGGVATAIPLSVIVKPGGAIINDGGFAVSVLESLQHDSTLGAGLDGGLVKQGAGTLTLTLANTYNGGTIIDGGTLAVNGSLGTGGVLVNTGGTLSGTSSVGGAVTVTNGGTLAPGGANTIGTLTIAGSVTNLLGATNRFLINKGSSPSNSVVSTSGTVTYAGTLVITNGGAALAGGDSFKLYNASGYSGAFGSIVPATPGTGLTWNTANLIVNGTLSVQAAPAEAAHIGTISISGTTLTITGTGGAVNGTFHVVTSTTLTTPVSSWTPFGGGGSFNNSGQFTFSGTVNPADPMRFFAVVSP